MRETLETVIMYAAGLGLLVALGLVIKAEIQMRRDRR